MLGELLFTLSINAKELTTTMNDILHVMRITNKAKRMRINTDDNYLGSELTYLPQNEKIATNQPKKLISRTSEGADGGWGHEEQGKKRAGEIITASQKPQPAATAIQKQMHLVALNAYAIIACMRCELFIRLPVSFSVFSFYPSCSLSSSFAFFLLVFGLLPLDLLLSTISLAFCPFIWHVVRAPVGPALSCKYWYGMVSIY